MNLFKIGWSERYFHVVDVGSYYFIYIVKNQKDDSEVASGVHEKNDEELREYKTAREVIHDLRVKREIK